VAQIAQRAISRVRYGQTLLRLNQSRGITSALGPVT
jgi:hypothetical protein